MKRARWALPLIAGLCSQSDAPFVREGHDWMQTVAGLSEVHTAAGAIKLRSVEGALPTSTAVGNVFADLPSGARLGDSFLNAGSGDIVVLLASNPAVTIRARNESTGAGRVVSEFPEIRVAGMPQAGSRPLAASGGVIYLRRQS